MNISREDVKTMWIMGMFVAAGFIGGAIGMILAEVIHHGIY